MAMNDYRLCDKCGQKTFYDARLSYEDTPDKDYPHRTPFKVAGKDVGSLILCNLGDWAVLCRKCSKLYKTQIVPIKSTQQKTTDDKDELIRASGRIQQILGMNPDALNVEICDVLSRIAIMLSRSIVWQEGEPPRDEAPFQRGAVYLIEQGLQVFCYHTVDDYVDGCGWFNGDVYVDGCITRHAILTPPQKEQCCACFGENS